MQIAIPVLSGNLSEYLGACGHFEIYGIEEDVKVRSKASVPAENINKELSVWLEEKGITDIILHKANPEIIHRIASKKVNLFVGVSIDSPLNLIEAIIQGRLESDINILRELTSESESQNF